MPILLRLLLLLLAGASIVGARHATRRSNAYFSWPATPAVRTSEPVGQASIAELSLPLHARHAF